MYGSWQDISRGKKFCPEDRHTNYLIDLAPKTSPPIKLDLGPFKVHFHGIELWAWDPGNLASASGGR